MGERRKVKLINRKKWGINLTLVGNYLGPSWGIKLTLNIYQERYMGLPDDNEFGYTNGSPITFAHRLKGNLLIIHGTGDDNVHYQSFERMVNELIRHNKKFTMMSYPNRSHSLSEGENTKRHFYELML